MQKGAFISDIKQGMVLEGLFFAEAKRVLETREGKAYIAITLMDKTGSIEGRIWDQAQERDKIFEQGDYVWIRADAQSFRDVLQLKIIDIHREEEKGIEPSHFLPETDADIQSLWLEFRRFIKKVDDPILSRLLYSVFNNKNTAHAFKKAPAAKKMHHACLGGLLEHTVSVARLTEAILRLYPHLDHDLLLSAALLHDIGKIEEFSYHRPPIDYTDQGRLIGHLVLGASMVDEHVFRLHSAGDDLDGQRINALKHLILSHHGQKEFGSPVLPMMEEAIVLNLLDDLDAKLNYLHKLKKDLKEEKGYAWTEFQRLLDRYFYLPGIRFNEDNLLRQAQNDSLKEMDEGDENALRQAQDLPGLQKSLWT